MACSLRLGSSAVPPVQVRAAGLAYVRSTRAWQLADNQRAPWKSAIFSCGWVPWPTRSVHLARNSAHALFRGNATMDRENRITDRSTGHAL